MLPVARERVTMKDDQGGYFQWWWGKMQWYSANTLIQSILFDRKWQCSCYSDSIKYKTLSTLSRSHSLLRFTSSMHITKDLLNNFLLSNQWEEDIGCPCETQLVVLNELNSSPNTFPQSYTWEPHSGKIRNILCQAIPMKTIEWRCSVDWVQDTF